MSEVFNQSNFVEVRYVKNRGTGSRGVFARDDIPAGTLIETVPVILMPDKDCPWSTTIASYVYTWIVNVGGKKTSALALGYGSLYNHSFSPNAYYEMESPDRMFYYAHKDIKKDDEITINYNGSPEDQSEVHFKVNNERPEIGLNRNKLQKARNKKKNKFR